jgi:pyrroline-5-carboxylate reductase
MGGALARAVCRKVPPERVLLTNRTLEKAEKLAGELGCAATDDNRVVSRDCDFLFLGVKPQMMAGVLAELTSTLKERTDRFVLVSMAAGLTTRQIVELAGVDCPVIRIMPNTPAAIGEGVILYAANQAVTPEELTRFTQAMDGAGRLDPLPEGLMDAGSALSGCGPAFVCQFIEALADGGVECGLPRDKALLYAAQTVSGTAQLMLATGQHPAALKDGVCSPGGSTIAGVHAMERGGLRGTVMDGVCAAFQRTKELGK